MLYEGLDEQARHEHMSYEYKDRYTIIALLKTPPRYYTDNARTPQWFPPNWTKRVTSSDRTKDLPNTYSRSTAETTMNPIWSEHSSDLSTFGRYNEQPRQLLN